MAADEAEVEIVAVTHARSRLFYSAEGAVRLPGAGSCLSLAAHFSRSHHDVSAVCYYFGGEIHSDLNVPVGLIVTATGGTMIEPWTPPSGVRSVDGRSMADYRLLPTSAGT